MSSNHAVRNGRGRFFYFRRKECCYVPRFFNGVDGGPDGRIRSSAALAKDPAASEKTAAKPEVAAAEEAILGEFVIGKPLTFKNMAVFPVASKTPQTEDRYMTLEEGLKSESVQVYEVVRRASF